MTTSNATRTKAPKRELLIFQSLWGMEQLPGERGDWSLEEKIDAALSAGFDGIALEIPSYDTAKAASEVLRDRGAKWTMECYPQTVDDLAEIIEAIFEFGAEHCDHINLQPNVRPHTVLECIPLILGWQRLADDAGLTLNVETHRDRMTTDLLFTLQLIDAVPSLRLTADLSHYLVGREFRYPISDENHSLIHRILDRSWSLHGRVASREQVQIPLQFPQNRQWVDLFLDWWEYGFRSWRSRADDDESLIFSMELGTPWYAITGPDGAELSDRWEEALWLKELVRARWEGPDQPEDRR